ncbi:DNA polymerase-3 subunit beta [Halobacillus dabanensis]|uniref:Beta sliding clamp n=1 Tax=Halobacillus dabanensis TaxID=240302 RepID=A0A1I3THT4_HALDA|nr:DNA polymerase III subunit beta [Halobacillus dabanensis]SFJ70082.1 DNA polymerase-3 subunit beta [Halobacillus dabanensis]
MEFFINEKILSEAVADVAAVISQKSTLFILKGIKIEASEDGVRLTGSNSDLIVEKQIPAEKTALEVIHPGTCVLPGSYFQELVKKLPGNVHMKKGSESCVTIHAGDVKTTLSVLSEGEYPRLPELDAGDDFSINGARFLSMIRETMFAVATDGNRPILTGVHLSFSGGTAQAVATNSQRLAMVKQDIDIETENSCTVPKTALKQMLKLFRSSKQTVRIWFTDHYIQVKSSGTSITSRLLDGRYPNVADLIPNETKTVIIVDRLRLMEAVDRAGLFATEWRNHNVHLKFIEGNRLRISSYTPQIGNIEEVIRVNKCSGDDLVDVYVDGTFLLDALKVIHGKKVDIRFHDFMKPMVIQGEGDESQVHLISPVRA